MTFRLKALCLLMATWSLAGCETVRPKPGDSPEHLPVPPMQPIPQAFNNGAIYQPMQSQGLFEDYKARRIGDLLSVVLVEQTNAAKSATTSVSKGSEIDMNVGNLDLFGRRLNTTDQSLIGGINASGDRSFDGSGTSSQSNRLSGQITVTVADVLSNGNLLVQGEKWLGLNQGKEYVRLRGIVRPVDITANNTVLSTQIADVQVHYGGTGALADSNTMGWVTRFFVSAFWPL